METERRQKMKEFEKRLDEIERREIELSDYYRQKKKDFIMRVLI